MSSVQRLGAIGLGVVAVGLAVFLMQPPAPGEGGSSSVAAPNGVGGDRMADAPGSAAPSVDGGAKGADAEGTPTPKAAAEGVYDDDQARKGPFDYTPAGGERLLSAHQRRVAACRTALASKAKGPISVKLTIRSSEGGPGYVAQATPDPEASGVNVALGPCLSDAFGEARFPDPYGEKELVVVVPEP